MAYFGLQNTDIVNSFSQAISSDFAIGAVDGYTIIDREIEFQYEKLLSVLSDESLRLLDKVNGEVASVNVSGYFYPTLYAIESSLRAYIVYKGWKPCSGQNIEYSDGYSSCWENQIAESTSVSTANLSAFGNNHYQILDSFDFKTQNLVLYYDVDNSQTALTSLRSLLRDMVCASLGSRIYPAADADKWSIVKYYSEEATKRLEFLEKGGMPSELKKMVLINGKNNGIRSVKVVRG